MTAGAILGFGAEREPVFLGKAETELVYEYDTGIIVAHTTTSRSTLLARVRSASRSRTSGRKLGESRRSKRTIEERARKHAVSCRATTDTRRLFNGARGTYVVGDPRDGLRAL